jgi:hypothetical protein
MTDKKLPSDPNGLHFAAGAFIGGMTGLILSHMGQPQQQAAMVGLLATCIVGAIKALYDGRNLSPVHALKNGALIASGGLITPLLLWLPF